MFLPWDEKVVIRKGRLEPILAGEIKPLSVNGLHCKAIIYGVADRNASGVKGQPRRFQSGCSSQGEAFSRVIEKRHGDLVNSRCQIHLETIVGTLGTTDSHRLDRSAIDEQGHFRPDADCRGAPGSYTNQVLASGGNSNGLSHTPAAPNVPTATRHETAFGANGRIFNSDNQGRLCLRGTLSQRGQDQEN